jgi:hypothetical protein
MKMRVPLPCKKCNDRHVEIVGDRLHCCRCHDDRGAADPTMIRFFEEIERQFGPITEPAVYRSKHSLAFELSRAALPASDAAQDLLPGPDQTTNNE